MILARSPPFQQYLTYYLAPKRDAEKLSINAYVTSAFASNWNNESGGFNPTACNSATLWMKLRQEFSRRKNFKVGDYVFGYRPQLTAIWKDVADGMVNRQYNKSLRWTYGLYEELKTQLRTVTVKEDGIPINISICPYTPSPTRTLLICNWYQAMQIMQFLHENLQPRNSVREK